MIALVRARASFCAGFTATMRPGARAPRGRLLSASRPVDARSEHLMALVKDGATLEEAARVYRISGERVRQLLKASGTRAGDLPGRAEKQRSRDLAPPLQLAPVIEAMWREGLLSHEIATVFDTSCEAVHRLICERVPPAERSAQTARRLDDARSSDQRLLAGVRRAKSVLAQAPVVDAGDRRHAQAVIGGWLAAHSQLIAAWDATPPVERPGPAAATSPTGRLSPADLRRELERFRSALRAGGISGSTIHAYLLGSSLFVRWLVGDYLPRGRSKRSPAGGVRVPS